MSINLSASMVERWTRVWNVLEVQSRTGQILYSAANGSTSPQVPVLPWR